MILVAVARIPYPERPSGFVEPGETVPDDLDGGALIRKGAARYDDPKAEIAALEHRLAEIRKLAGGDDQVSAEMSQAKLLELAAAEGVEGVSKGTSKADIVAAIEAKRAEQAG